MYIQQCCTIKKTHLKSASQDVAYETLSKYQHFYNSIAVVYILHIWLLRDYKNLFIFNTSIQKVLLILLQACKTETST